MKKLPGQAYIRNRKIVIELDIDTIPIAVEGGVSLGVYDLPFKITDADAFAKDVVHALNDEDEQGTSAIHIMFDAAFQAAVNDGAQGWQELDGDEDDLDSNDPYVKAEQVAKQITDPLQPLPSWFLGTSIVYDDDEDQYTVKVMLDKSSKQAKKFQLPKRFGDIKVKKVYRDMARPRKNKDR